MDASKGLKITFFSILLMAAGYFFGTICKQISLSCNLILNPSIDLLYLLLWLMAAICAVAVAAGLVAILIRPVWVGIFAFLLSGLTMLLGWQLSPISGTMTLIYVLGASFYTVGIAKELKERIRFSVRPISEGQGLLLMALLFVSCGSLYLGCSEHIKREGVTIPDTYIEMFMKPMKQQILSQMPEEQQEQAAAEMEEQFQGMIDRFLEETVKPYEQYIPLMIAGGLFFTLNTIMSFASWIPPILLKVIFPTLKGMKLIKEVSETKEVKRFVIGKKE